MTLINESNLGSVEVKAWVFSFGFLCSRVSTFYLPLLEDIIFISTSIASNIICAKVGDLLSLKNRANSSSKDSGKCNLAIPSGGLQFVGNEL